MGIYTAETPAPATAHPDSLPLDAWQTHDMVGPATAAFDDRRWFKGDNDAAPQMGADGDLSCYAWYRARVSVNTAGDYRLRVKRGGDYATLFVDGVHVASGKLPGDMLIRKAEALGLPAIPSWAFIMAAQFAIAIIVGYVTTRAVEFPFLRIRDALFPAKRKGAIEVPAAGHAS